MVFPIVPQGNSVESSQQNFGVPLNGTEGEGAAMSKGRAKERLPEDRAHSSRTCTREAWKEGDIRPSFQKSQQSFPKIIDGT
jgi:hypothetical protein